MAHLWYGIKCNSHYIEIILEIDLSVLEEEAFKKYQVTVQNKNGVKVAAPDLRKEHKIHFLDVLLSSSHHSLGFRNKDLKQILGKDWKTAQIAYERL